MALPLLAIAAPYLIGGAMGVVGAAARGNTDPKSLLFGGLTGAASGGVGAGMFGGGAGAAGGSGISAGTGGAGGTGGWWSNNGMPTLQRIMGGGSFGDAAGAGGGTGSATSNIGPWKGHFGLPPTSQSQGSTFIGPLNDPNMLGGVENVDPNTLQPMERIGGDSPDKPDSLIKKGKKTRAKVETAQAPSSSGSTRGGGTSASISGGDLGGFNFASAPGISPVSLPQRSATFDPGFKSLSSSSGLPQGRSSSRYTPQTGMNPTLQKILAGYARDRRGYA